MRNCLFFLTCVVLALGLGCALPILVLFSEGAGSYSGEKKVFAKFALVYDSDLREWPFPIDPSVARRVTEVSGTHDRDSPCNSEEVPETSPYYTGYFAGDYKAEVVHYGPFFIPTGKNVFHCDGASTHFFLLPGNVDGALFNILGLAILLAGFAAASATVIVPLFLILGGCFLWIKGPERNHRRVGLAALASGLGLSIVFFLAVSTTAI